MICHQSSQYDFAINQYSLHYIDLQKYNCTTHPKGYLRDWEFLGCPSQKMLTFGFILFLKRFSDSRLPRLWKTKELREKMQPCEISKNLSLLLPSPAKVESSGFFKLSKANPEPIIGLLNIKELIWVPLMAVQRYWTLSVLQPLSLRSSELNVVFLKVLGHLAQAISAVLYKWLKLRLKNKNCSPWKLVRLVWQKLDILLNFRFTLFKAVRL